MYIQHSVHIQRPIEAVSAAMLDGAPKWFPELEGKNVARVGIHVAGVPVRKKVTVEVGKPSKTSSWAVVPISWKATFAEKLFPVMTGKIELAPSGKDETRLTVSGMYEPPLGKLGARVDEALMHNVAEGTVRELAKSIADNLNRSAL